ncbi:hypothetical protein [Paracoccus sp. (in: a-proteobacteria)]|uniref:hypothetical protein n=1 Tax=Paracoccus sp. TaxID=267 RepID=UPI0026E0F1C6|nr:hypothetical protein [Paracoccus sp. (in: a-proteobacteria)]MDO5648909.1 hypothetical protein [Paracoccus sp. (in: a-proteobacteria)]
MNCYFKRYRRHLAMLVYPEWKSEALGPSMEQEKDAEPKRLSSREALIALAEMLAAHQGVTHYAISMRAMGKGDFFKNMIERGYDCRTRTAARLMQWFADNWPADLEWPADVPRPRKSKEAA